MLGRERKSRGGRPRGRDKAHKRNDDKNELHSLGADSVPRYSGRARRRRGTAVPAPHLACVL
eukprot:12887484-Prorocentrum_lima.AAC.1